MTALGAVPEEPKGAQVVPNPQASPYDPAWSSGLMVECRACEIEWGWGGSRDTLQGYSDEHNRTVKHPAAVPAVKPRCPDCDSSHPAIHNLDGTHQCPNAFHSPVPAVEPTEPVLPYPHPSRGCNCAHYGSAIHCHVHTADDWEAARAVPAAVPSDPTAEALIAEAQEVASYERERGYSYRANLLTRLADALEARRHV